MIFCWISPDIVSGLNTATSVSCGSWIILDFCEGDAAEPVIMKIISNILVTGFIKV
jgi:hypothetical protein